MNRVRVYSDLEIEKLLLNPNVIKIKNKKQIVYNSKFKYWAVLEKKKNPDKTSRQIFEEAGFDMSILSDETPPRRLLEWTRLYNKYGEKYFKEENKYTFGSDSNNKKMNIKQNDCTKSVEVICSDADYIFIVICDEETDN